MAESNITIKLSNFCKDTCPACTRGREKGKGFIYMLMKIEDKINICPFGRAYKKVYEIPLYEKITKNE